ncbi:DUF4282 domain-containing protein [Sulfurimonas sp.]|uniref:DUF4282 domain-containing protein n=1 Tax=Sulfurimonas sp. TaxID=2022749 RepID=UPI00262DE0E1|nr:DUF4282 domain-containing protein [Sulfurimonas sp.]
MDFLRFNTFITQDVLIFFYYIFAILVPLFLWYLRPYILKKVSFFQTVDKGAMSVYKNLDKEKKFLFLLFLFSLFFCMELCLRMVFEAMIGYFDMHNYLYEIATHLKGKSL